MTETPRGWQLLHSKLPSSAIKPLATAVYGVAGLSDVNEGYLIRRLFGSELLWEWRVIRQEYLGFEDRVSDKGKEYRVYLAAVHGELTIDGRVFHGSGAHDNRKLDAALKGAATVAFKNACKWAGLTAELFLDGRSIDVIYSERVRKDQEMVPETVAGLTEKIIEAYGDPAEGASTERAVAGTTPRGVDAPSTEDSPLGLVRDPEKTQGGNSHGVARDVATPPPAPSEDEVRPESEWRELEDLDMDALYKLARELPNEPQTALAIRNLVVKHGYPTIRRRLLAAHALQCKSAACEHVAVAAGMK